MRAKLKQTSEGLQVVIDETLVRQLGINGDTEVDMTTDGRSLIVEPVEVTEQFDAVARRIIKAHAGTLRKLAK
ncbi:MAG TPA: AbrB/MazE/SpoVT family DNA-binding domain-containing protein [Myxococcales bacterium]|jgi:antitoxin component of MazEF toxin-antitoxin module